MEEKNFNEENINVIPEAEEILEKLQKENLREKT